ncbi:hypothetical protein B0H17DRAFT_126025 [Mycena rosella]|uniref:Uncharacterized protein n=1 Tax=Mycena rosella TaxID=1033263 RepID=A0AAD7G8A4_MYCRO|nr:hypothetical protein B0H17DRAFT_126025 [Mycena rosella]
MNCESPGTSTIRIPASERAESGISRAVPTAVHITPPLRPRTAPRKPARFVTRSATPHTTRTSSRPARPQPLRPRSARAALHSRERQRHAPLHAPPALRAPTSVRKPAHAPHLLHAPQVLRAPYQPHPGPNTSSGAGDEPTGRRASSANAASYRCRVSYLFVRLRLRVSPTLRLQLGFGSAKCARPAQGSRLCPTDALQPTSGGRHGDVRTVPQRRGRAKCALSRAYARTGQAGEGRLGVGCARPAYRSSLRTARSADAAAGGKEESEGSRGQQKRARRRWCIYHHVRRPQHPNPAGISRTCGAQCAWAAQVIVQGLRQAQSTKYQTRTGAFRFPRAWSDRGRNGMQAESEA